MYVLSLKDQFFHDEMEYPRVHPSCKNYLICQECFHSEDFDVDHVYNTINDEYPGKYRFEFKTKASYDRIICSTESQINVFYDDSSEFDTSFSLDEEEESENEECAVAKTYFDQRIIRRINGILYGGRVKSHNKKTNKFSVRYVDGDDESITRSEVEDGLSLYEQHGDIYNVEELNTNVALRRKDCSKSYRSISTNYVNYLGACREDGNFFSWGLNGRSEIDLTNVIHFDRDQMGRVYFKRFMIGAQCK